MSTPRHEAAQARLLKIEQRAKARKRAEKDARKTVKDNE